MLFSAVCNTKQTDVLQPVKLLQLVKTLLLVNLLFIVDVLLLMIKVVLS